MRNNETSQGPASYKKLAISNYITYLKFYLRESLRGKIAKKTTAEVVGGQYHDMDREKRLTR